MSEKRQQYCSTTVKHIKREENGEIALPLDSLESKLSQKRFLNLTKCTEWL